MKDNLVTEMKAELKLLTIENLIIPDDNNHSIKQSKHNIKLIKYNNFFIIKSIILQVIFH